MADPGDAVWADRSEVIRRAKEFAAGDAKLARISFPENRIPGYGDVVICFIQYDFEIGTGGERNKFGGRGTDVFVRLQNRWLNSAWQLDH